MSLPPVQSGFSVEHSALSCGAGRQVALDLFRAPVSGNVRRREEVGACVQEGGQACAPEIFWSNLRKDRAIAPLLQCRVDSGDGDALVTDGSEPIQRVK